MSASGVYEVTGGGLLGNAFSSVPQATLTASPAALRLKYRYMGEYEFRPDEVIAIERNDTRKVWFHGIQIRHNRRDYPEKVFFYAQHDDPVTVMKAIAGAGFEPVAPESSYPERRGNSIVRWQAIAGFVLLWFAISIARQHWTFLPWRHAELVYFSGYVLLVILLWINWTPLQRLVTKPGRHFGEIRHQARLIPIFIGFMFIAVVLVEIFSPGFFDGTRH